MGSFIYLHITHHRAHFLSFKEASAHDPHASFAKYAAVRGSRWSAKQAINSSDVAVSCALWRARSAASADRCPSRHNDRRCPLRLGRLQPCSPRLAMKASTKQTQKCAQRTSSALSRVLWKRRISSVPYLMTALRLSEQYRPSCAPGPPQPKSR
eukprot:3567187-Prymnesium_polylepis.1